MSTARQIAIDGPAGSGKSTVAKCVAEELGYTFVDTGAMYRCVALAALRAGFGLEAETAIGELAGRLAIGLGPLRDGRQEVTLDGEVVTDLIRTPEVTEAASPMSAIAAVRSSLVAQQRRLAAAGPVVMEGRDIQTVVLPEAEVKVYLSATPAVRAQRRQAEPAFAGLNLAEVEAALTARDERDSTRAEAPLKAADDAVIIETDALTIEQVTQRVVDLAIGTGGS